MPTLTEILHPDALVPTIARAWEPPDGMGCCVLVRLAMLARVGRVPREASELGQIGLGPWAALDPDWKRAMLDLHDSGPWDALYANWVMQGSHVELHAPKLTRGCWHIRQAWNPDLRTGGHTYLEHLSEDGQVVDRIQSGRALGYRHTQHSIDEVRWPAKRHGILTLPLGA